MIDVEIPIPKCCNLQKSESCKHFDKNNCMIFKKMLSIEKIENDLDRRLLPIDELKELLYSKTKAILNNKHDNILIRALSSVIMSNYTKCVYVVTNTLEQAEKP